jgi:hypothetical protein
MVLKRTKYQMPDFIRDVLNERGLMDNKMITSARFGSPAQSWKQPGKNG